MENEALGPENAIRDDGEWISWDEINRQIQYKEWRAKYPNADIKLVPVFEQLLSVAQDYFLRTGRHLQVYGDIGELFASITHGVKLHSNYAQGSDGRLGDDFVEVKTITPFNKHDRIAVKLSGNFSKLFVVKLDGDFQISGKMIDRRNLPKGRRGILRLKWAELQGF